MRACLLAFAALSISASADAEWYRASSEHFLIYSQQKPEALRQFAENLEKFDGAVRAVRGMGDLPLSQGNRITIFTLRSAADVQRLYGGGFVEGFYRGSAARSVAFVLLGKIPETDSSPPTGSNVRRHGVSFDVGVNTILLHEYSHHLMMQDLAVPYPEWLVEGFAEFMSTAQFEADGSVGLGLPARHRYYGLLSGQELPIEKILSGRYDRITLEERESIYGRGWLLTHYLTFEPSRKGQLEGYLAALARGEDGLIAAKQYFGDLGKLNHDLNAYLHRPKLQYIKVSGPLLKFAPIQIATLSAGASAAIPLLMELSSGTSAVAAERTARKARAVEPQFLGDELVETTLAEAELDANHPEAAEQAADRAAGLNPRNTDAIILQGRAIAARAVKANATERHALFEQARDKFIAANRIDPEDPEPLMEFCMTFALEGVRANANAIAALHYASDLAPQDLGLRMNSAVQYLAENKPAEARRALIPIAYNPHDHEDGDKARDMVSKIDSGDLKAALAIVKAGPRWQPASN